LAANEGFSQMPGLCIHGGMSKLRRGSANPSTNEETIHHEPIVEDSPAAHSTVVDAQGDVYCVEHDKLP